MSEIKITYDDLIEAHKSKDMGYDEVYSELILPIKNPWEEIDSIIEFVRRWNSRVPVGRNKDKIKEAVLTLKNEFDSLKHFNLEDFEFNTENTRLIGI